MEENSQSKAGQESHSLHGLLGATSVESDGCPECGGAMEIPWFDGDGSEKGMETCPTCCGTGTVERIAPNDVITHAANGSDNQTGRGSALGE